jgi:Sulfotransferase family
MVLVSHSKQFVFLKTRKSAGTSIEMILEPFCAPPGHAVTEETPCVKTRWGVVGRRMLPRPKKTILTRFFPEWHNHMAAPRVAKLLGQRRWAGYAKISSVREPFDRTVSLFHWHNPDLDPTRSVEEQFREFVRGAWQSDDRIVHVRGKLVVDHFIRYESLRKDLERAAAKLGLPIDIGALPHAKDYRARRNNRPLDSYYDAETVRIVRDRMRWVFDAFDYPEEPARRLPEDVA